MVCSEDAAPDSLKGPPVEGRTSVAFIERDRIGT